MEKAGTNIEHIKKEWSYDLDFAEDWTFVDDSFDFASRWCTHWTKVFKHDSGMLIAVSYARNIADGNSASSYKNEWYKVEEYKEEVTKWRKTQKLE